jgi:hypothetical protein
MRGSFEGARRDAHRIMAADFREAAARDSGMISLIVSR